MSIAKIEKARGLLVVTPDAPARPLGALGAAALAAAAAILMAGVMVLGPGVALDRMLGETASASSIG
ncbi:MAG: peptidoglycan-binding protein [Caulobacteraceae bacterium]|nr:MAG: peptidoglycan-binding protein [Caulobacteraceae bacterium]